MLLSLRGGIREGAITLFLHGSDPNALDALSVSRGAGLTLCINEKRKYFL